MKQIGFSVTSVILAGQILHSLNSNFPLALGVVLIGCVTYSLERFSAFVSSDFLTCDCFFCNAFTMNACFLTSLVFVH